MQKQSCDSALGLGSIQWFEKVPEKFTYKKEEEKVALNPVLCADNVTTCDPLKTCCRMADGSYGCCPYTDGVCCSEFSSCCPQNTVCGEEAGECISISEILTIQKSLVKEKAKLETCSGDLCSPDSLCCKSSAGVEVCCPYTNGTCCGSHGFCCPAGYTCNTAQETCTLNDDLHFKIAPKKIVNFKNNLIKNKAELLGEHEKTVDCADSLHFCPDSQTCCKLASKSKGNKEVFGCCPFENAICCDDGINW
jgi:hypothetical protein